MQTLNDVVVDVIKAYVLNALWQEPLLWLAAELVARWMKSARAAVVHRLWVGCLMLAVVLPAAPLLRRTTAQHVAAIQVPQRLNVTPAAPSQSEAQIKPPNAMPAELPDAPQTSFGEAKESLGKKSLGVTGQQPPPKIPWKVVGMRALCVAYLLSVFFAVAKLSWGLWRTARLLRRAKPTLLHSDMQRVWEQCCARSRVNGVRLLSSPHVESPSTLTFRSAVILLPAAMPECGEAEMAAALCHELAHVWRRDFLKNLAYEFAIAPLFFHPAVHAMARRVQETRELACDDMAAEMLDGRAAYASSLLRLAETMSASVAQAGRALGVFEGNVLEKRVMNLIETRMKQTGWRVVLPVVCGVSMLAASCVASLRFGLRPVFASSAAKPAVAVASANAAAPFAITPLPSVTTAIETAQPAVEALTENADENIPTPADTNDTFEPAAMEPPLFPAQAKPKDLQDSVTGPAQQLANPGDLKPVAFKLGHTYFEPGDNLTIDAIRGSSDKVTEGNVYEIKGHYTLVSHDSALLAASLTTSHQATHPGGSPSRNMTVNKGSGEFTVWLWIGEQGQPHLSFYPSGGGSSFAGVYFESESSNASVTPTVPALAPGQTREAPKGWSLQGNDPTNYLTGVDKNVTHEGQSSAYLLALADNGDKFGTLSQWFKGKEYLGKRVRFRAWVRSKDVSNWAGLWMRVDEEDGKKSVAFDNMQNRAIKGTNDWKLYDVVLDVPKRASDIDLGILLTGPGEVWMSGVQVEVVGPEVALTDMMEHNGMPDGPTNLDFGK